MLAQRWHLDPQALLDYPSYWVRRGLVALRAEGFVQREASKQP